MSGIGIGLLYINYYTYPTDTEHYHNDASIFRLIFLEDYADYLTCMFKSERGCSPFLYYWNDPRALFFAKFISPVAIMSLGNYWVTSMYISLLSFSVSWSFLQKMIGYFPKMKQAFFIVLMLFPSVVFWSSGLMKEAIILPCIFYVIMMVLDIRFNGKIVWWRFLLLVPCLFILLIIKYYVFAVLIPMLLTYLITERFLARKKQSVRLLFGLVSLAVMVLIATLAHPNLNLSNIIGATLTNHDATIAASKPGTFVDLGINSSSSMEQISFAVPKALFAGLFGPFPGQARGILGLFSGLENSLIFVLSLLAIVATVKYKIKLTNEAIYTLFYTIVLAVLLTIASPNYGTLVRYKVMFLPFYLCLIIYPTQIFLQNTVFRKK